MGQVGAQQLLFFLRVVVGHANQGLVAQGKEHAVHGIQHIHKQSVGEQRHQHGHLHAALRCQRTRCGVGHIAQLLHGDLHAVDQVLRYAAFAPQSARCGDGAHASGFGHVAQGDTATGAAFAVGFGQGFSLVGV